MSPHQIATHLKERVPVAALDYCFLLWTQTPFLFKLTKTRQSKVGDFTCRKNAAIQRISINHDLNPYLFLITYIHEVAHLRVYLHYGMKTEAHGGEWKHVFQRLMEPVLNENTFPLNLLRIVVRHMKNPKASSFADTELTIALRQYDPKSDQHTTVAQLPEGSVFKLQGKFFKKGKIRRTRILCHEIKTKRQYLVPAEALVTDVQLSLL